MWLTIYILLFILAFGAGIYSKTLPGSWTKAYQVKWSCKIGTVHKDLSYGPNEKNTFDLYLPNGPRQDHYGLVVYLHAGGFTSGDKADDKDMLQWLCSKGYVAVGINYTLRDKDHPSASVYSQSMEIKESIPAVIEATKQRGYVIDKMAIAGGSAGHCLAMLYAYRDGPYAPVPLKMVFGAVGPSSFYPEDWSCYGFDQKTPQSRQAAAELFSVMAAKNISPDLFDTPAYDEAMKDVSPLLWIDKHTVPSLLAYGKYDKIQSFEASKRLDEALTRNHIPHDYLVFEHSGHGLQNDDQRLKEYYEKIESYLDLYLEVTT